MPKKLTKDAAYQLYERLADDSPAPKTELNYHDPYTLLVAVTLSAQATDIGVNKATDKLFKIADTPQAITALGVEKLGEYIKTIGLWRNKAKNVVALSQILLDEYDGAVPENRSDLEKLPGVGRKTANVVCNVAFGQPTIAVDTHIFRIGNRTGLAPGKDPLEVERSLEKITPEIFKLHAHHWLILHGRYICKARTPDCPNCIINDICLFKEKTTLTDKKAAPSKKSKKLVSKPKLKSATRKKSGTKRKTTKKAKP